MNMITTSLNKRLKSCLLIFLGLLPFIALALVGAGFTNSADARICHEIDSTLICRPGCPGSTVFETRDSVSNVTCPELEDDTPDCGKNPYVWNPIGQHYQRKFHEACYFVTWDENDKTYHGLWLDQTPLGP